LELSPKQCDSTSLGSALVVTELAFCEYAAPVDGVDVIVTVLEAYFVESATLMAETVSELWLVTIGAV
jgi:hypothetical protein